MNAPSTPPKIAVVIPFYQREAGILSRAISSALNQVDGLHLDILVVDDGSPVSAERDLGPLLSENRHRIRVLHRSNGGPGAARNTALDALPPDTDYVAFLDSDDAWTPTHLSRALSALGLGYDFYFSDFFQLGQTISAFARAGGIDLSQHRSLVPGSSLYEYVGDMFTQILTYNVIGTSTVVYRRSACPDLRFQEDYSHAGEDYLFWLDLSTGTSRFAFSSEVECTYGKGVNVYSGSGWGTEGSLRRAHCEFKYLTTVGRRYPLSPALVSHVSRALRHCRRYFVRDVLHRLAHHKPIDRRILFAQLRTDGWTAVLFVPIALAIALAAARARWTVTSSPACPKD